MCVLATYSQLTQNTDLVLCHKQLPDSISSSLICWSIALNSITLSATDFVNLFDFAKNVSWFWLLQQSYFWHLKDFSHKRFAKPHLLNLNNICFLVVTRFNFLLLNRKNLFATL
jgi:hypothetical protein